MSLFSANDVKIEDLEKEKLSNSISESGEDVFNLFKQYDRIENVIADLIPMRNIHFACMVEWSCHELLHYILQKTGPAKVYIATWSISEGGARYLSELMTGGMITELHGLFDYRSNNRHPAAFHLAKQYCSTLRLYPNHAKVSCVINDNWSICLNGSANYTNKKRIEAGVLSINNGVAEMHRDRWILPMIQRGEVFE